MLRQAAIQVQLRGVHLCCQGCVDAVDAAVKTVEGVESHCNVDNATVTLTTSDDAKAQKALDSIAAAGFHGNTDNKLLAMNAVSKIPEGNVEKLKVSRIHNCCDLCCEAIKGAIQTVEGVVSDSAESGETSFEVTGNFDARELVKALNVAGFSAQVEK